MNQGKMHTMAQYSAIVFCCLLIGASAWAGVCRSASNSTAIMSIDLGMVSEGLSQPVPVGGVLAARSGLWDSFGGHNSGWCQADVNDATRIATLATFNVTGAPLLSNVYATNLRGVSVRISIWSNGSQQPWASSLGQPKVLPFTQVANLTLINPPSAATIDTSGLMIKVELIKTASVWDVGPLSFTGDLLTLTGAAGSGGPAVLTRLNLSGTLAVRTCAVVDTNILVRMGTLDANWLNRHGFGDDVPLSIRLMCQNQPKVLIQFEGETVDGGSAGVIRLYQSAQQAKGVGIQLRDSGSQPVPLNRVMPAGTPPSDGVYQLNYLARYIKTGLVSPGKADAAITFSMSYE